VTVALTAKQLGAGKPAPSVVIPVDRNPQVLSAAVVPVRTNAATPVPPEGTVRVPGSAGRVVKVAIDAGAVRFTV
jgi:hypothetical protein